jgi:myo-inositol-1(or 4)-monophosphatase
MSEIENRQLLHLVIGGELKDINGSEFRDPTSLNVVGVYPNYKSAYDAWKSVAQSSVDNALMRYFIVHIHRLLDPVAQGKQKADTAAGQ